VYAVDRCLHFMLYWGHIASSAYAVCLWSSSDLRCLCLLVYYWPSSITWLYCAAALLRERLCYLLVSSFLTCHGTHSSCLPASSVSGRKDLPSHSFWLYILCYGEKAGPVCNSACGTGMSKFLERHPGMYFWIAVPGCSALCLLCGVPSCKKKERRREEERKKKKRRKKREKKEKKKKRRRKEKGVKV